MLQLKSKYFLFISFIYLFLVNGINLFYSDFTSNLDFDLTVIYNSIQIFSNQYQDYRDHPGYTQFLIFGFVYKFFSLSTLFNININNFNEINDLYLKIKNIYYLFKCINTLVVFFTFLFFFKILHFFSSDRLVIFTIYFCALINSSVIYNILLLRADIFSLLFFLICFYLILDFFKNPKSFKLILFSLSLFLAAMAKIQIIVSFALLFFFFPIILKYENFNLNEIQSNFNKNSIISNSYKLLLVFFLIIYFIIQIILNNLSGSRFAELKYFDLIIFLFFVFFYFFYLKLYSREIYVIILKLFCVTIFFFILIGIFFNILSIVGLAKLSPYILLRFTNPFYYLKVYSSYQDLSFYTQIFKIFSNFNFVINYHFFFINILLVIISFFSRTLFKYKLFALYFFIFSLILNLMFNFRFTETYGIHLFLMLLLSFFFYLFFLKSALKSLFLLFLFFFSVSEIVYNFNKFKALTVHRTNLDVICINNSIKKSYWWWARGLDDNFFKKICSEKNLKYIKFSPEL